MLSKISSIMRQFHVLKGVTSFLAWLTTQCNYFSEYFCQPRRMCVQLFTLPNFVLSLPTKTNVSSVNFSAAIIIQRSVFCTVPSHVLPVPHNYHRILSRHQCRHHLYHQTISMHEYASHPLHYVGTSNP